MSRNRSQHPKVFISYSWDSLEHKNIVLNLAERLRIHGIDCNIDQFEVSPSEGWLNWMRNQVEESDFVLLVCTEKYYRRYRGKEKLGQGKGVVWEGAIISQLIYDQQSNNKFIPVIFEPQADNYIPYELRQGTWYLLNRSNFNLEESGYEALYRHITKQTRKKISLGDIVSLPPLTSHQVNIPRENEQIQQEKLTKLYQDARRYYQTRYWKKAIAVFQEMQENDLPYYDPDGLYRLARNELLKGEQTNRRLENLYDQGKEYYQDKNWFEAQRKFKEILSFQPRDKDFLILVEQKLRQSQKQLGKEKNISITLIIISWLMSVILFIEPFGFIGGTVSGFFIWWISQRTKRLEPSKLVQKLLLFISIGFFVELIIWQILGSFLSFGSADLIKTLFVILIGSAISIKVMFWQINNRMIDQ